MGEDNRCRNNAKETDAEGYVKVADASFGGSGWQVVTFEDVENVTNVKIKPTATLEGYSKQVLGSSRNSSDGCKTGK